MSLLVAPRNPRRGGAYPGGGQARPFSRHPQALPHAPGHCLHEAALSLKPYILSPG